MKIQYFSDLHLELLNEQDCEKINIQRNAPILVLCGDIGNPYKQLYEIFLRKISVLFDKIFIITGNHEYYFNSIIDTNHHIRELCKKYPNISFLQNSFEDYQGYRFAGTTLWSYISNPLYINNDFYNINNLTIDDYNNLHFECKKFIQSILDNSTLPVIMLSHHLPSHQLTDPFYSNYAKYQQCFSSDCNELIQYPIIAWIYGHTHRPYKGILNGINLYCNPIGYKNENKKNDFNKIIDLMLNR